MATLSQTRARPSPPSRTSDGYFVAPTWRLPFASACASVAAGAFSTTVTGASRAVAVFGEFWIFGWFCGAGCEVFVATARAYRRASRCQVESRQNKASAFTLQRGASIGFQRAP